MHSIFDHVYDVLFSPAATMSQMSERRPLRQSLLVGLVSVMVPALGMFLELKARSTAPLANVFILLALIAAGCSWVLRTAIWSFIAECLGGKGTALELFGALGFAYIPFIFLVPLWVLAGLMPVWLKPELQSIFLGLVILWAIYLEIAAVRGAYRLSWIRAVFVLVTPVVAVLCLGVLLMMSVTVMLAAAMPGAAG